MADTFDPDLIHSIFKLAWSKRAAEKNEELEVIDIEVLRIVDNDDKAKTGYLYEAMHQAKETMKKMWAIIDKCGKGFIKTYMLQVGAGTSKKNRSTTANSNALKVSCELLRIFVTETVQRASVIAEAEGINRIEATHLERILPQLLLDF